MAADDRKKFFDSYYLGQAPAASEAEFVARWARVFESCKDNYLPLLPADRGTRILDVGCGAGHFLYFLKQQGYTAAEGVEVGEEPFRSCQLLGLNVHRIDDLKVFLSDKSGAYDVVSIHCVIEHISKSDVLTFLATLRGALRQGGQIMVSTENMARLSGLVARYNDITHEVGYTERSLEHVLHVAGFTDVRVSGMKSRPHLRIRNLAWLAMQWLWKGALRAIYLIEMGSDRPRILDKDLLCVAVKTSE